MNRNIARQHRPWGRLSLLLIALTLLAAGWTQAKATDLAFVAPAVEKIMQEWGASGAIVVVVANGEVFYAQGFGFANVARGEAVDIDRTVFRLASLSKPVTSSAAMLLAQQRRLDLDEPIDLYLPGLVASFDGVTAAHLMTHTAGFVDRFLTRTSARLDVPDLTTYLSDQMPSRPYAPGEISLYSNHGIALLGLAIATISGNSFEDAMQALVFEPLEMHSTSFAPEAGALAQGYLWGQPVAPRGIKTVPASMLSSTGADMAKWMLALTGNTHSKFLSEDFLSDMLARQFEHHPELIGRTFGFSEDSSVVPRRVFHSGALEGFSSGLALVPDSGVGVLIALNGRAYVWELMRSILDVMAPAEPVARPEAIIHGPPAEWSRAEGRYVPADLPRNSFDRARLLFEQSTLVIKANGFVHNEAYFEHAGGLTFRDAESRLRVLRKGQQERWFFVGGGDELRRISTLDAWPIHLLMLVFLMAWFSWQLFRPMPRPVRVPVAARLVRSSAFLNLVFLVGLGTTMAVTMAQDGGVLRHTIPWYVWTLLSLPLVAITLTLLGVGRAIMDASVLWHHRWVLATLTVTALYMAFLAYWRLLGYHF